MTQSNLPPSGERSSFARYLLMTCRLDMLWLPAAFWALFVLLAWMTNGEPAGFDITTGYFGAALPLIGGILAAYAVLDDPALELQFATPRPAWRMLAERMGMILAVSTLCALAYQLAVAALGIDLSPVGGLAARQLAWFAPTAAMIGLASAVSFANRQSMAGAVIVSMVWIFQIIARDWFLNDRVGQYLLLVMGSNYFTHPALRANQAVLVGLGALLLAAAWALLRRQERYI